MKNSIYTPVINQTLCDRIIRPIRNWNEWLQLWFSAEAYEVMLGLLHTGFSVSFDRWNHTEHQYDSTDRIKLYFEIADGWENSFNLLRLPADGNTEYKIGYDVNGSANKKTPYELRKMVATKAFDMLCVNFFKPVIDVPPQDENYNWKWERSIMKTGLLKVISGFFCVEDSHNRFVIRNLSRCVGDQSFNEKHAISFLLALAQFLWQWKEESLDDWPAAERDQVSLRNHAYRKCIDAAKPWMIEVLEYLGQLGVLEPWIFELDKPCLDKLMEIAMRSELGRRGGPVNESRCVCNLDEACHAGSPAAWFIKQHELKTRERTRLAAIMEAELEQAAAARKIQELTSKS
ncbi:MAG: hypothetical protein WCQ60_03135 [bacterium]